MNASTQDLAPQCIRLFYRSGLLDDASWESYATHQSKNKSLFSILNQEVSLDSFRDLLFADLSFKSKSPGSGGAQALRDSLSVPSIVNHDELLGLFANYQPPLDRLLPVLRRDGILGEASDAQLKKLLESGDTPSALRVAEDGIVTAPQLCQWLGRAHSEALQQAGIFLSLYIMRFNEMLPAADFERMKGLIAEMKLGEVRTWLAGPAGLGPRPLLDRAERGLRFPDHSLQAVELPPALMSRLPETFVRRHVFVPLDASPQAIEIVTADPFNLALVAFMRWLAGVWIHPRFAPSSIVIGRINQYYFPQARPSRTAEVADGSSDGGGARDHYGAVERPSSSSPATNGRSPASHNPPPHTPNYSTQNFEPVADNVSAVQLASTIIEKAITLHTTDVHIEPTRQGLLVRFRIDGNLQRILTIPAALAQPVVSRIKVLAEMDVTERRRPQDGHFELDIETNHFDFRISTLPVAGGEKVVIRILEAARVLKGYNEIGFLAKQQQTFEKMIRQPYGLSLVTGPTGSGKTSTLYSALHTINHENRNIVTIEDPVEYQLEGINQVEVDPHIGLTFSEGLRSILRQDPDVIMVGEIRDPDTSRSAIRAAMTGHLVFSTLHTNTALGAIDALIHLGAVPFMLAGSLIGIVNQRLVRLLCTSCRRARTMNGAMARQLGLPDGSRKKIQEPVGCPECLSSGYSGRTGVFEVVGVTDTLRPRIAAHEPHAALEQAIREDHVMTLQEAGVEKVLQGATSVAEVAEKIMLDV